MGVGFVILVLAVVAGSVAGCSSAIAGRAVPAPGAAVRKAAPRDIRAACPLLPAGVVESAYHAQNVTAQEQPSRESSGIPIFKCRYGGGGGHVLLEVAVLPDVSGVEDGFIGGVAKTGSGVRPVTGIGDTAELMHPGGNAKVDAMVVVKRTGGSVLGVLIAAPAKSGDEGILKDMVRRVYARF